MILASYKGKYGVETATVEITVVEQIIMGNVLKSLNLSGIKNMIFQIISMLTIMESEFQVRFRFM